MQQDVYHRVEENTLLYPLAEVTRAINTAVRSVNCHTGFYQQTVPLPALSIPGRAIYDVPAPIFIPLNVRFEQRALEKNSLDSACYSTPNILTRGGIPKYWTPLGLRKFSVGPIDRTGGRFLSCTGICDPPVLVNPTDYFVLGDEFVLAIEDHAFLSLIVKEGGKVLADALRTVYPALKTKMRSLSRWDMAKNPNLPEEVMSTR